MSNPLRREINFSPKALQFKGQHLFCYASFLILQRQDLRRILDMVLTRVRVSLFEIFNMSNSLPVSDTLPQSDNTTSEFPTSVSMFSAIIGVIGFVGLIVPEIWLAVVAFVWSAQGLFHLSSIPTGIIAAIISIPALWASYHVVKMAIKVEFQKSE